MLRSLAKFVALGCLTSKLPFGHTITFIYPTKSNAKHLEEIKNAGYELPAVNQIEVSQRNKFEDHRHLMLQLVASLLSTEVYCGMVPSP